jgi:hypothetical protein
MRTCSLRRIAFGVALGACAWVTVHGGDGLADPWTLVDPAFDRYVDFERIGAALRSGDAEMLTDCALQLAEGERVLMRLHKVLRVRELLQAAAQIAADRRDEAAMVRIAQVAELRKDQALVEQIEQVRKLASAARDEQSEIRVSIEECTPRQFSEIYRCCSEARLARLTGDARSLEAWTPDRLDQLPDPIQPRLEQLLAESRTAAAAYQGEPSVLGQIVEQTRDEYEEEETEPAEDPMEVSGAF